jgi:hypothetical protein
MTQIQPEPGDLLRRADAAIERFDEAKASGDPTEIAKARRHAEAIRSELARHADTEAALQCFKKALGSPQALFEQSPGAALAKRGDAAATYGGALRKKGT